MRDIKLFPDDENGDVLWYMKEQGDNLSVAREMDFVVAFRNEKNAHEFAIYLLKNGLKVSYDTKNAKKAVDVYAHPFIIPTYENITQFEKQLAEDAEKYGGELDGWGSFKQDEAST